MKRLLSVFLAVVSLMFVCSCSNKKINTSKKYALPQEIASVESGLVAENEKYMLTYDSSVDNLILYDKNTENIVSTIPYEHYSSSEESTPYVEGMLNSAVVISCIDNKDSSLKEFSSYDSVVLNGKAYSVKIDNGVRVIYFFDEAGISVPVDYTLTENGIKATILLSEITEGAKFRVYKIALLPYFASAKNNSDSYLFVPSGRGALMYTDDTKRNIRTYSEAVYGEDATHDAVYKLNRTEQIYMPVFGAKNKDSGIFAVIEEGSELAYIQAKAGDSQIGFSSVFSSFYLSGKDIAKIKNESGANQVINKIGKDKVALKNISVNYIFLQDDATYNGMAEAYRNYLKDKGYFANDEKEGYLYLDVLGGALVNKSFFGISYKSLKATTTVAQAEEIIKDVSSYADKGVIAVLKGFGNGGLDKTVLGGGFKLDSALGNKKQISALVESCKKQDVVLAMDFDLIHYTKSGKGFSLKKDSARNLNNTTAKSNYFTIVTNQIDNSLNGPALIKRSLIASAADKAINAVKNYGLGGISLSSMSSVTYGDYSNPEYYVKSKSVSDFKSVAKLIKKNGLTTVCSAANMYAAVNADYVFAAPTNSSKYIAFDKEIPFYQMTLKGNVSVASPSLNLEAEPKKEFLKAVSTGSALQFAVSSEFDTALISGVHSGLAGSVYGDIKQDISDMYEKALPLLEKVRGSEIKEYTEKDNLAFTEFGNGVKVYTNFSNNDIETELGTVKANDFIFS